MTPEIALAMSQEITAQLVPLLKHRVVSERNVCRRFRGAQF